MTCKTCEAGPECPARRLRERLAGPERLVGIGFRCWLAGYETCDINCWEAGWRVFAGELGSERAKGMVTELACWIRALSAGAARKIEYYPIDCAEFCQDECLGVAMIAAGQHRALPVLKSCAGLLLGSADVGTVEKTACDFAHALDTAGIRLDARLVAEAAMMAQGGHAHA